MAQGVLTGKYLPGQPPPAGSRATDEKSGAELHRPAGCNDDVLTRVQQLKPLAEQAGLTMAQLAVAWVLQNPNVASAIIGASRPEQVHDNVKAAGVKLDAELLKAIDDIVDPIVERDPAKTETPAQRPDRSGPAGGTAPTGPVTGRRLRSAARSGSGPAGGVEPGGQAEQVGDPEDRVEEPAADARVPQQREEQEEAERREQVVHPAPLRVRARAGSCCRRPGPAPAAGSAHSR